MESIYYCVFMSGFVCILLGVIEVLWIFGCLGLLCRAENKYEQLQHVYNKRLF